MRYLRNKKTISGRLSDELVMMDMEKGKYFSLNPVATRIWDLLDEPRDIDELCSLLTEEYEVDAEKCRAETLDLLQEMTRMGLVSVEK